MTDLAIQLVIGLLFSALIGYVAYRRGSLSKSGILGAVIVGTSIFGFGGWAWGLTLIAFFVSSSLLSHYKKAAKEKLAEKFDKGARRDIWQALANGGVGALMALLVAALPLYYRYVFPYDGEFLLAGFIGAMATVNADTWATELGVLNKKPPRLLTTFEEVEVGTSGGISWVGTLAALAGALFVQVSFAIASMLACKLTFMITCPGCYSFVDPCPLDTSLILVAGIGGLLGSLFDSYLGATVQAIYYCPACHKETEKTLHTCGTVTEHRRGWRWLNNDWVNFIASAFGALVAMGVWGVLAG